MEKAVKRQILYKNDVIEKNVLIKKNLSNLMAAIVKLDLGMFHLRDMNKHIGNAALHGDN